jgi:hypothetical protein
MLSAVSTVTTFPLVLNFLRSPTSKNCLLPFRRQLQTDRIVLTTYVPCWRLNKLMIRIPAP